MFGCVLFHTIDTCFSIMLLPPHHHHHLSPSSSYKAREGDAAKRKARETALRRSNAREANELKKERERCNGEEKECKNFDVNLAISIEQPNDFPLSSHIKID